MDDRGGDRHGERRDDEGRRGGGGGPSDTSWLQLEMSKVLEGEAESLAREVGRDILREAIRARLKERIGARLEALGHVVADRLADDLEANLEIEALIARRRDARRAQDARIADALCHRPEPSSPHGHDPHAPGGEGGQR